MSNENFEDKLYQAVENTVPDVWGKIITECEKEDREVIVMNNKSNTKSFKRPLMAVAAAVALVVGIGGLSYFRAISAVSAIIGVDVNPSVEISVNNRDKVLEVNPLNPDAKQALKDMNLKNTDLNVALNAVLGAMYNNGYISDTANSVLISVAAKNDANGDKLIDKISSNVKTIAESQDIEYAVLTQKIDNSQELKTIAQENEISVGKAKLISNLILNDNTLKFDDLATLNMNDLNLLAKSKHIDDTKSNIVFTGSANDTLYIGTEKANAIALSDKNLSKNDVTYLKTELDRDDGLMIYEVSFIYNSFEYEYEIDAQKGIILDFSIELDDDNKGNINGTTVGGNANENAYLTREKALDRAYKQAKVDGNKATNIEVDFEIEDGIPTFNIEFTVDGYEYDIEINGVNGNLISYKTDYDDDKTNSKPNKGDYISEKSALSIAYKHAKATANKVSNVTVKLDDDNDDDDKATYEIEFWYNGYEYDYDIDAVTGNILSFDTDYDDDKTKNNNNNNKNDDNDDDDDDDDDDDNDDKKKNK